MFSAVSPAVFSTFYLSVTVILKPREVSCIYDLMMILVAVTVHMLVLLLCVLLFLPHLGHAPLSSLTPWPLPSVSCFQSVPSLFTSSRLIFCCGLFSFFTYVCPFSNTFIVLNPLSPWAVFESTIQYQLADSGRGSMRLAGYTWQLNNLKNEI